MELRQLRYFVAIADSGSFSKAAERVFVAQSALSHQLAQLESELGAALFHRSRRGVVLALGYPVNERRPVGQAGVRVDSEFADHRVRHDP